MLGVIPLGASSVLPPVDTVPAPESNGVAAEPDVTYRLDDAEYGGAGDVDVFGLGADVQKGPGPVFAEQIGHATAHQQGGQGEIAGADFEADLALFEVDIALPTLRVPVPVVAAVVA